MKPPPADGSTEEESPQERITFCVRDTGIGMTDEQVGRLFQAFSQADASTTRKYAAPASASSSVASSVK